MPQCINVTTQKSWTTDKSAGMIQLLFCISFTQPALARNVWSHSPWRSGVFKTRITSGSRLHLDTRMKDLTVGIHWGRALASSLSNKPSPSGFAALRMLRMQRAAAEWEGIVAAKANHVSCLEPVDAR